MNAVVFHGRGDAMLVVAEGADGAPAHEFVTFEGIFEGENATTAIAKMRDAATQLEAAAERVIRRARGVIGT